MQSKRLFNLFLSLVLISVLFVTPIVSATKAQTAAAQTQSVVASEYAEKLNEIEKKVEERRKALGIPGMSLAIVKDDKIIYMKGLGYKDFEKQIPVTPDTLFAIGSVTKSFTGMAVVMSQDDGKLSLSDSPKKYLSYFKMRDPEADMKITVRDLLRHNSGLNRTDLAMITGKLNRAELIQVAGEAKPTARFGEKFQYQNIMYSAAGEVVAAAQQTTWENFTETRIFKPLGMTNSYTSINAMTKAKDASFGYAYNVDTKETRRLPYRDIPHSAPAGSIASSAKDMTQWIRFILNGGAVDGKRLVSEKGFNESTSPQMEVRGNISYGFGWMIRDWNGHRILEHGGSIDGFNSQVAMMPDQKLGFVMLTNVSGSPLGNEIMELVWSAFVAKPDKKNTTTAGTNGNNTDPNAKLGNDKVVGKYRFEELSVDVDVTEKDGKLFADVPGQPQLSLENVSGNRYKLSPVPGEMFATFRPSKNGNLEIYLEMPQGNFVLPKAGGSASPKSADAYKELVGSYEFEKDARGKAEIAIKENALTVTLPNQPTYTLLEVQKDVFGLEKFPDSYRMKVKRDDKGKAVAIVFVQPEGEFLFNKAGEKPPIKITADELMAKVVEAMGHANLSKYKTVVVTSEIDFENQGVKGIGTSYAKAPNKAAMNGTLTALGKEIGTVHEYFDGVSGATELSFMPTEKYTGKRLANATVNADFNGLANWKTLFKKVEIKGMEKVGEEEVYVVEMATEKGTPATYYVSTKSFLVLRRDSFDVASDSSELQIPITEMYSDYRAVNGVMYPFKTVQKTITNGNVVITLKEVKFDADIPDTMFQPKMK